MLYQKATYFKGNKVLIEDDEEASQTRYMKACPGRLFKHELEAHKQKTEHTSLNWYAMKRFYRLKTTCSSIKPDEKPQQKAFIMRQGVTIKV